MSICIVGCARPAAKAIQLVADEKYIFDLGIVRLGPYSTGT
jgi:hypothetical protein